MDLQVENERLQKENRELRQLLEKALQRVEELERRLGENSRNSHWPSSRDKVRLTKSQRRKSEKKAGGQAGHVGQTLGFSERVDERQVHRPERCGECEQAFSPEQVGEVVQRRQVIDLPEPRVWVVEHQSERLVCEHCGSATDGTFPCAVSNPVQYGPRVQTLGVYLKTEQLLPYERSQRLLADVFGVALSPGSLQNFVTLAAARLTPIYAQIAKALRAEAVVHFDESGFYIAGQRQWLHTASSQRFTYYYPHARRGKAATEAMGILPQFCGIAQHDHWATYWRYTQCQHALCNAHHLRELAAITETYAQPWAQRLAHLLVLAKRQVETAKAAGLTTLPAAKRQQIDRLYTKLVAAALLANPPPPTGWPQRARGKVKKTKPRNLAERLQQHHAAVLAFVSDFKVPFDNNLAERDLRMLKIQQKISGCFRSPDGATAFCVIRSYTSTLRKQAASVWNALASLFSGSPIKPAFSPV